MRCEPRFAYDSLTGLLGMGAAQLAREIAAGNLSASEVVEAHIHRIEEVDGALNAVVVPLFDRARQQAADADARRSRNSPLGPLHGVPVTIKECFYIAGTDATVGVDDLRGLRATEDSPLVRRLTDAGAIVLGKTNVPQLMIFHETDNPVYGRTNNPWDLDRGPGGSSGGEAAIIAAGGSPLGLGSDLGGSIRQPAHSCGIVGLKPTSGWPPLLGSRENISGLLDLEIQPGPLARRVEDLALAMQVLVAPETRPLFAPRMPPVPWRDPARVELAGCRVAMWTDDGCFTPSPAIRRAVREAADALRARGVVVEEFTPPEMPRMLQLYLQLISADGGETLVKLLGRSRRDWRIQRLIRVAAVPRVFRPLLAAAVRMAGQPRLADLLAHVRTLSTAEYRELGDALRAYTAGFFQQMAAGGFDALLFPPYGLPALRHGSSAHLLSPASGCFLANVLNAPAGVVPITRVRADEESDRPPSRELVERAAREVEQGSAGLPVGVQIAAPPWRDDLVLALMQALETDFNFPAGRD